MPPLPRLETTFVWDLEASDLLHGGHRPKGNPPSITQFAMRKYEHVGGDVIQSASEVVIGGGKHRGYTNILEKYITRFNVVTHNNIPDQFFKQLVADGIYGPSVLTESQFSPLNKQVRNHVKHLLQADGPAPTVADYMFEMKKAINAELDKGKTVNLLNWNKHIDTQMLVHDLGRQDPALRDEFVDWLTGAEEKGLRIRGGETGIHEAMFEDMMKNKDYVPHFADLKKIEQAHYAGKPIDKMGMEIMQDHHALRAYVNDIKQVALGEKAASEVWKDLPEETQSILRQYEGAGEKRAFEVFQAVDETFSKNIHAKSEILQHYTRVVRKNSGEAVAAQVSNLSFTHTGGIWGMDSVRDIRGEAAEAAHDALQDTDDAFRYHREYTLSETAKDARTTFMNTAKTTKHKVAQAQIRAGKFGEEMGGAITSAVDDVGAKLTKQSLKGGSVVTKALGRLSRKKWFGPAIAAAGALMVGTRLHRSIAKQSAENDIPWQMEDRIQALRAPNTQFMTLHGIMPSKYPGANISSFGSGRDFSHQLYNEQQFEHPNVGMARQLFAREDVQRAIAWRNAQKKGPVGHFSPVEARSGLIDLSEYLMEVTDADTIALRRAWLDRDIPVLGPMLHSIQSMVYSGVETFGGREVLNALTSQVNVRLSGIDAPETDRGSQYSIPQPGGVAAKQVAIEALRETDFLKLDTSQGMSYGRYVATPMANDGKDISRMIVAKGGAMAVSNRYQGAEEMAMSAGQGIWREPFFWGMAEAKKRGLPIAFSQMSRIESVSTKLDIATAYSAGAWAHWGRSHYAGYRDQRARMSRILSPGPKNSSTTGNYGSIMA